MTADTYDVAIVGCGPVGMTLAALLADQGLQIVAFEREPTIGYLPRARHIDGEAMRVLQTIGIAEACEPEMKVLGGLRLVDRNGRTLLEQTVDGTRRGAQGWVDDYQMFQPLMLEQLRRHLEASGSATVRVDHEVTALAQHATHVNISVVDRATGCSSDMKAAYVIGCDGADSWVRRAIGAQFDRLGPDHSYLVIDGMPERSDFRLREPVYSVNVCDPARPAYVSPGSATVPMRFEFMVMPGEDHAQLTSAGSLLKLIEPYVEEGEVRFDRAAVYVFHSLLVDRWRIGRVLLAGDSAHVQPPFMGQGLCSGFRDASNLAWKLAMVCHGKAGEELLESYQAERAPHARAWIDEANRIGAIVMTTDEETARRRDEQLLAGTMRELRPITPILGAGLHGDAAAPAGTLAPQASLDDGRRMDEVVGYRFLVVATSELLAEMPAVVCHALDADSDIVVAQPGSPEAIALLEHYGGGAVIIRPDRYVLGVAHGGAELERVLGRIPSLTTSVTARPS